MLILFPNSQTPHYLCINLTHKSMSCPSGRSWSCCVCTARSKLHRMWDEQSFCPSALEIHKRGLLGVSSWWMSRAFSQSANVKKPRSILISEVHWSPWGEGQCLSVSLTWHWVRTKGKTYSMCVCVCVCPHIYHYIFILSTKTSIYSIGVVLLGATSSRLE